MTKQLLTEVLSTIRPKSKELREELDFAEALLRRIKAKAPPDCEVVLTGSIAKRTFLQDRRDVDIFVLFERTVPKEMLESAIKKVLRTAFPGVGYQLSYAEHPYVRFHFKGRRIDLVPAYRISKASERISAVDRSVLHTAFVKKNLNAGQRDGVLLLKQFLKSNSLYGAEIKIEGFSGYLCELLIIKHKTFVGLLKAASKWKAPVFIDLQKEYRKKEIPGAVERFGFFAVIDPTDKNRNVAAAVSDSNFKEFIKLSKTFLKKPSKEFFFRQPESFEQKVSKAGKSRAVFIISMPRPQIVDDVLWGQLHKLSGLLEDHMEDFGPRQIIADDNRHLVRLGVVLEKEELPAKMLVEGPPLKMEEHAERFRKMHRKAKFTKKKGRIYAEVKRPVTDARKAITQFFKKFSSSKSHLA